VVSAQIDPASRVVAKRLRALRQAAGVSQEELGRRAKLTAKFISQVENGHTNPSIGVVARLASGLGLSLSEFFDHEKPARPDDVAAIVALVTAQPPAARKRALKLLKTFFAE
jgi:transcriptional regulator with XRE-family HTH domain